MLNSSILIHGLNICIGCLCATILGLTAHAVTVKASIKSDVPTETSSIGMSFLFWPGVGGIVDALLFVLLWMLRRSYNQQRLHKAFKAGILFVAAFIVARPFIVLVYTFVESSSNHDGIETWACDVSDQDDNSATAHVLCTNLRAARYLLIPVLVLSVLFLGLVVIKKIAFGKHVEEPPKVTLHHGAEHLTDSKV